jgi:hypothetical protein
MDLGFQGFKDLYEGNVLKNSWLFFALEWLIFLHQSEGETSAAGEQLVSNKVDAITIEVGAVDAALILFLSGSHYGLKNSFVVRQIHIPFDEVYSMFGC